MQSTFWKAVALTGVISIGCFVVYEVHRRMPKQPGENTSSGKFQVIDGQQPGGEDGDSGTIGAPNEMAPPVQHEPGAGQDPGDGGNAVVDATGAAPWELIPQRTETATAARDASFLNIMESAATSDTENSISPVSQTDASATSENGGVATVDGSAVEPLFGTDQSPLPAAWDNEPGSADGDTLPGRTAAVGTAGESRAFAGNTGDSQVESAIGTDDTVERDVQPAGGTEFPANSVTDDPFTSSAALESTATMPDAGPIEQEPAGLFGTSSGGPPLDRSAGGGDLRDAAGGRAVLAEPHPLPGVSAEPLADESMPNAAEGNSTFDPFAENGAPSLPPEGSPESPESASTDTPFATDNAEPEGNGLTAPQEFVPFDAAERPRDDTDGASGAAPAVVLPSDAPAEFPVGSDRFQPDALPAAEDAPTMTITPARERRPDRANTPQTAVPPRRDFAGDGTLTAHSPSGPQQPELKIEKVAPTEATVGDPLVYAIRVSNVGRSAAHDVVVEDRIPRGTTLDGTIPRAEMTDKKLLWRLGTIEPGGEQMIRIRVVPTEAGEIGSVATVRFVAEVAAATVITRPELSLEMTAPGEVAVGEQATFHFKVVNSGAADARDVIIRSLLPRGLEHPDGNDVEYPLGRLRAGETREIELTVLAKEAGQLRSQGLVAVGTRTYAEQEAPVLVIPSRLLIRREGPARRFVGRKADYTTTVTNRSGRDLQQVTVEEQLPAGLELAAMPKDGQFDSRRRTITWKLPMIRAGESISLKTSVVAQSPGTLESIVRASDAGGNKAALASRLDVAGFSALAVDFEHAGSPGPVSVGEQVSFRLTVKNRGTAPAEGVQALFEIPEHLEFVHADGPVAYTQEGQVIRFSTLDEIAAKDETSFNIVLTAAEAGAKRVTAELTTPTLAEPLRNDQAVVVEADE
jgi:uncharacterized repeat protein (TIGR01451 family)